MYRLSVLVVVALLLSACVTQTTYGRSGALKEKQHADLEQAARTRVILGLSYLQQNNPEQAKFNLERARNEAPQLPEVHNALAYYYQQVGESQRAEQAYQQALSLDPHNGTTLNNYGVFLCNLKRYQDAERKFARAVALSGYVNVAEAYENAGVCAKRAGHFEQAERYLQKVLNYSATRSRSLLTMAEVQFSLGKMTRAADYLHRYQQIAGNSAKSALLGYRIAQRQGDAPTMQQYRNLLISRFPDVAGQAFLLTD